MVNKVQPAKPQQIIYSQKTWLGFFMDLVITTVPMLLGSIMIKRIMKTMDPNQNAENEKSEAREELSAKLRRNGRSGEVPPTNRYEDLIMADMVFPDQIDVSWTQVGGLETLKEQIYETVVLPLQNPGLFSALRQDPKQASLATVPRGILFYGPPGTGKTMLAKVIAKDCGATFINVRQSTLQNKWFGESQKLVRALFSLARKCAPTIIFLDEIDLFFRERTGSDHEATSSMKSEFMSLWDGLTTNDKAGITVLGATNRPFDIDLAILRRLPRTFLFELPTKEERMDIVKVQLSNQKQSDAFNLDQVASQTVGYSGSDLKELCKYACMVPVRRLIRELRQKDLRERGPGVRTVIPKGAAPAPLTNVDVDEALKQVKPTGSSSYSYRNQFESAKQMRRNHSAQGVGQSAATEQQMRNIAAMVSRMMQQEPQQAATPAPPAQPNNSKGEGGHSKEASAVDACLDVD